MCWSKASFIFIFFVGVILSVSAYKPVILIHGLFGHKTSMTDLQGYIAKSHPGTNITIIDDFNGVRSVEALWKQTDSLIAKVTPIMEAADDGVIIICYSQGGLVCRAMLSTMSSHNVETFISLSAPQMGQYGDTTYFQYLFPNLLKEEMYRFLYTALGQHVSIGNYWNDPHHHDRYLDYSNFLAVINNQTGNPKSEEYRKNFLRIKNLVLIGGPDDGVITPWQSSQFGFIDTSENVVPMLKQEVYMNDWFGLKTLNKQGGITTCTCDGVYHRSWHSNSTVYFKCIEQWLV